MDLRDQGAVFYHAAQWRVGGTQHHPYTCIYSKDQSIWLRLIRNCHQGQELTGQHCNQVSGAQGNTGGVGQSNLGAMKVYIDDVSGRLNTDGRGRLLGAFDSGEKLIACTKMVLTNCQNLTLRVSLMSMPSRCCRNTKRHGHRGYTLRRRKGWTMVKRFKIETNTLAQKFCFIPGGHYLQTVFCYHPYRFQY